MSNRIVRILLLLLLVSSGVTVYAQGDSIKVHTLEEFEITAPLSGGAEVIPAQRLSGRTLESLNSHSVADAIRYFSGAQIKDYGGVGGVKTVDVRSMGSNHLGVFYDGIQLGNPQNGQIDLGKYSLDNIEEISLYNGQKSQIFQPARDFASAASIYLRTRRPKFSDGKNLNAGVLFRTGSFGLVNPSVRLEYRFSESVNAAFNAEYTYASGRYKFRYKKMFSDGTLAWDTTAVRENGDIHSLRLEGSVFGKINGGKYDAKIYFYDSEKGIPGAIVNNVWKNAQRQWDRNIFVQGNLTKSFTERYEMMLNAKYAHDYMHYQNPDTTLMYIDNQFRQDELYFSIANKVDLFRGLEVDLSVDYQWNKLDATLVNFSRPVRHTLLAALAAAYQLKGLRVQASLLCSNVFDRSYIVNGSSTIGKRRNNLTKFTPAVFVSWQPFAITDLSLRAFYKRIFRMPTFNDLYYTDMGNADLKPEYATQYDVGLRWRSAPSGSNFLKVVELSADGYYNLITDKIIAVPKGTGQYRWMMMNIGRVRILGLDVVAGSQFMVAGSLAINCRLAYTYQLARDYSSPDDCLDAAGTYRGQIAYIPRHSGSVVAGAEWRGAGLNYSFIYVGERWENSSNIPANYVQPWYTHDLSVYYGFRLRATKVKATLEVNNLFNQQYEVIANYPMPGRNFRFILQFDI